MKLDFQPYLELLRAKDWRGYFLIASFGFVISKGFLFSLKDIVAFYAIIILLFGFGFSVNDCFDTKEDKLVKDKKNPVALQKISLKNALIFSMLLAILALALSSLFGTKVFLLCLGSTLLGFFYSSPPLRIKSRPWLDLLSHGLFAGVFIFLIPLLIFAKELTLVHYLIGFSIFYFSIILELRNHIEDYETDKKANLKTTVCIFGLEKSEKLLQYLAVLYPLTLLPIFFLLYQQYLWLFLSLTMVFLFIWRKKYKSIKNYRIIDIYASLSFILLVAAMVL